LGLIFLLVLFGGGVLVALLLGLTGILTSHRRSMRSVELEMALKQQMVAKEMSAEDIERVIRATRPGEGLPAGATPPVGAPPADLTARQLDAHLATALAVAGMEGERLQEAVAAVAVADLDTKRAVVGAVDAMISNGTDEEQMHAAILGLCKAPAHGITKLT